MPDAPEYDALVAQAEAAANNGDLAGAGALLRQVLARQEAALGATHIDLASTLNNLAVVCESTGAPAEAERFYRRAYAVAHGARGESDPLVVTAHANLVDFCRVYDLPVDEPLGMFPPEPAASVAAAKAVPVTTAPAVAVTASLSPVAPARQPRTPAMAASPAPRVPASAVSASTTTARAPEPPAAVPGGFAGTLAVVAVIATVVVGWLWLGPTSGDGGAPTAAPADARTADSPPASPPAPAPDPPPTVPSAPEPTPATATPAPDARLPAPAPAPVPVPPAPPRTTKTATANASAPGVVVAEVCQNLDTSGPWRCAPLESPAAPGRAAFFTRIASAQATTVQHRWLLDGRQRQSVTLRIGASPVEGYRTFSRQTLTPGRWQVVLVAADGTVLRESTFDVR